MLTSSHSAIGVSTAASAGTPPTRATTEASQQPEGTAYRQALLASVSDNLTPQNTDASTAMMEGLLKPDEVADLTGVCASALRDMRRRGTGPEWHRFSTRTARYGAGAVCTLLLAQDKPAHAHLPDADDVAALAREDTDTASGQPLSPLTPKEVAVLFRLSRSTLYAWRRRGRGPRWTRSASGRIFYAVSDLCDWLRATRQVSAAQARRSPAPQGTAPRAATELPPAGGAFATALPKAQGFRSRGVHETAAGRRDDSEAFALVAGDGRGTGLAARFAAVGKSLERMARPKRLELLTF